MTQERRNAKKIIEKGIIRTEKKVYMTPLPSTYKETELSEDLNDGMKLVFRDYRKSLKQAKDPLPTREDVMEFYVLTNAKELEKNIELQGCPNDLHYKFKEVFKEYRDVFSKDIFCRPIQGF